MTPTQLKLLEFGHSHVAFAHRTALDFIFESEFMEEHAFATSHWDLRIPLIQGVLGNFMFNDFLYEVFDGTLDNRAEKMFKTIIDLAAHMQDIPVVRDKVLDKLVHHLIKRDGIYPCTKIIEKLKDRSYPVSIEAGFLIYCLDHSKTYAPLIKYVISRLKASPISPNGLLEAHLLFNLQLPGEGQYTITFKDWDRAQIFEIVRLLLDRLELAIPTHTADILEKYRFPARQKATSSRRRNILSDETPAFFNRKQGLSINYEAAALDPSIGTDLAQTLSLIAKAGVKLGDVILKLWKKMGYKKLSRTELCLLFGTHLNLFRRYRILVPDGQVWSNVLSGEVSRKVGDSHAFYEFKVEAPITAIFRHFSNDTGREDNAIFRSADCRYHLSFSSCGYTKGVTWDKPILKDTKKREFALTADETRQIKELLLPELRFVPKRTPSEYPWLDNLTADPTRDPLPPEFARRISEVFLSNPLQDEDILDDFEEILSVLDSTDSSNIGGDIWICGDMVEPYN